MPSEKRRQGNRVRIPDNTRCCIGVVVSHEVTVVMLWEGEILCLNPKSEHPLLKESGRLREYDRVYTKHSLFRIF